MIEVGVVGAAGRMGAQVVSAVDAADDLHLAAAIDLGDPLSRLEASGTQVAVDFTTPDAVMGTLRHCAGQGIHAVKIARITSAEGLQVLLPCFSKFSKIGLLMTR